MRNRFHQMGGRLTTIATYLNHVEADIAASILRSAGFEFVLLNHNAGRLYVANTFGGIQLQVFEEDAVAARELLEKAGPPPDAENISPYN